MAHPVYPADISAMIQLAKALTPEQADALGSAWASEEGLTYKSANLFAANTRARETPNLLDPALQNAWLRITALASAEGRADELDAAIAAQKAVEHAVRFSKIPGSSKAGAIEAARSAVLAVGIRDLLDEATYKLLTGPWRRSLGGL